jgi:hypothetical protein
VKFFTGIFSRNAWLDRTKPPDYEWYPGEIDHDLWYAIIDTYGLPTWIRQHTIHSSQPVFSDHTDANQHGGFPKLYGRITTDCMCVVTHQEWIPVARCHWQTDRAKHTRLQNDQCVEKFYGYYAEDLKQHLLVRDGVSYFTGNSLGKTVVMHIPPNLLI